jgi:putative redox protein
VEPAAGGGSAPSPHEILDASLAACSALTLQLYIKRKGWPVTGIRVAIDHRQDGTVYRLTRTHFVDGELSDEQRQALLRIANACPVHKTLSGEVAIETSWSDAEP